MKVCHMEAMKEIRALEEAKRLLISNEQDRYTVSYKEGETRIPADYSYRETRDKIAELDTRIRKIRGVLALANATVRIEEFDVTIGEALVLLAQWNAEYERLDEMAQMRQISRRITPNGTLEYTECLFDVKEVDEERAALKRRIGSLQVAIDRANLIGMIEI